METAVFIGIGLVLGIAALPWRDRLGDKQLIIHYLMWACIWPMMVLGVAYGCAKHFIDGWRDYNMQRHAERMRNKQ